MEFFPLFSYLSMVWLILALWFLISISKGPIELAVVGFSSEDRLASKPFRSFLFSLLLKFRMLGRSVEVLVHCFRRVALSVSFSNIQFDSLERNWPTWMEVRSEAQTTSDRGRLQEWRTRTNEPDWINEQKQKVWRAGDCALPKLRWCCHSCQYWKEGKR